MAATRCPAAPMPRSSYGRPPRVSVSALSPATATPSLRSPSAPTAAMLCPAAPTARLRLWILDWELADTPPADWDEGARPYLEVFLSLHTPYTTPSPDRKRARSSLARLFKGCAGRGRNATLADAPGAAGVDGGRFPGIAANTWLRRLRLAPAEGRAPSIDANGPLLAWADLVGRLSLSFPRSA